MAGYAANKKAFQDGKYNDSKMYLDAAAANVTWAKLLRAARTPAWVAVTGGVGYGTNVTDRGTGDGVSYALGANNTVVFKGQLKATGSAGGSTAMFTLPAGYRPAAQRDVIAILYKTGGTVKDVTKITVGTDGTVKTDATLASGDYISLDGVRFPIS